MDILKDKTQKQYDSLSRYASFYVYYNTEDDKYMYGLTSQLSQDNTYVLHQVASTDTLDNLAFKYYGRPDFFWIIADFNHIQDPYINLFEHFKTLKVPTISNITFED